MFDARIECWECGVCTHRLLFWVCGSVPVDFVSRVWECTRRPPMLSVWWESNIRYQIHGLFCICVTDRIRWLTGTWVIEHQGKKHRKKENWVGCKWTNNSWCHSVTSCSVPLVPHRFFFIWSILSRSKNALHLAHESFIFIACLGAGVGGWCSR